MKYKIVADSSCNLTNLNTVPFSSVPLKIITSKREFVDNGDLNVGEMVQYLAESDERSHTSCPNVTEWLNAFEGAEVIFAVTITSKLSGSYTAAMQAKSEYEIAHPSAKVFVFDSLSTGPEMQLLIEKAAELMQSDHTFEQLQHEITEYAAHTHLLFSLESLKNLANNGRVSPLAARLSGLLGIRVIGKASDEGTLELLRKCRGKHSALSKIVDEMGRHYRGGKVRIAHCFNPDTANALNDAIKKSYPDADISVTVCTALCSYYAEQGGLLIGYEG